MFASAFTDGKTAPLIIDLIPVVNQKKGSTKEDFCEDNGNVGIKPGMPLAMERMKYILHHYSKSSVKAVMYWMGGWIAFVRRGILLWLLKMMI